MTTAISIALGLILASGVAAFAAVLQHIGRVCDNRSDTRAERALAAAAAALVVAAAAVIVLGVRG